MDTYLNILQSALKTAINGTEFAQMVADGALTDLEYNPQYLYKVDAGALREAVGAAKVLNESLWKVLRGMGVEK